MAKIRVRTSPFMFPVVVVIGVICGNMPMDQTLWIRLDSYNALRHMEIPGASATINMYELFIYILHIGLIFPS